MLYSVLLHAVAPAVAELLPQHIAVVVNRSELESVNVGYHYAHQRGIPETHVLPLDLGPLKDAISRQSYEQDIVQPLRKVLGQRGLAGQIRTLVTVYGMPLIVQAPQPNQQELTWATEAETHYKQALQDLEALTKQIAPDESLHNLPQAAPERVTALIQRIQRDVQERSRRLQEETDPQKIQAATQALRQILLRVGGRTTLRQALGNGPPVQDPRHQQELHKLQQDVQKGQAILDALLEAPSDVNRQRAYRLTEALHGWRGRLRLATTEIETFRYVNGDASLDSELSLLWVDPALYRVGGRRSNPLHYSLQPVMSSTSTSLPILMVSRLDAPTPALARRLVDQAIATEQQGLSGTVYLDSRGLNSPGPPGSVGAYDKSLQDLAALFRRVTPYTVVLEETERTLNTPGEAPAVAVYAGWYRLRAYEDVFTFNPGALGYHIASGEAMSVHDPKETGWCKNALERGITVTMGSTSEPYLDAFPPPADFFGLLLTGQYSLVEAYYLTNRYLSWRLVLFGDPLYNPWRGKGLARAEHLALAPVAGQATSALPAAPSTLPFRDPLQVMQELQQKRQALVDAAAGLEHELEPRPKSGPTPGPPGGRKTAPPR